ncbi:hypothetical protein [Ramlibacter sp. Leaf400]|uniref:hypothetical protein n=1 Tax=Ramlibacter sp. Leaf400 TaxID=1736365 RepID=UPI00138ED1DA|nr:hypothetical protein [Ramlibacter sp. Leaf400]
MWIRWKWILFVAAGVVIGCSRTDMVQREYADGASLRADGVITKGWVSESLPNDVRAIKLETNLDTNAVWMQFRAGPREVDEIARVCSKAELRVEDVPVGRVSTWWPGDLTKDRFNPSGFTSYRCGDGGLFAIGTPTSPIHFWRLPN